MEQKKLLRGCLIAIGMVLVVIVGLYFIGGDRFRNAIRETDMISAAGVLGEITSETVVEQRLDVQADRLTGITLQTATYARQNTGTLRLEVYGDGALLEQASVAIDAIGDGTKLFVPFSAAITDTDCCRNKA